MATAEWAAEVLGGREEGNQVISHAVLHVSDKQAFQNSSLHYAFLWGCIPFVLVFGVNFLFLNVS